MLTAIKQLLEDAATDQGLNFVFSSFKEVNLEMEDEDLTKSTILVNSSIPSVHEKTPGDAYKQMYEVHIACVRKREAESKDEDVFAIIAAIELDFLTYLDTVAEAFQLSQDLAKIKMSTLYFDAATPTAGLQAVIKMHTVGNCN